MAFHQIMPPRYWSCASVLGIETLAQGCGEWESRPQGDSVTNSGPSQVPASPRGRPMKDIPAAVFVDVEAERALVSGVAFAAERAPARTKMTFQHNVIWTARRVARVEERVRYAAVMGAAANEPLQVRAPWVTGAPQEARRRTMRMGEADRLCDAPDLDLNPGNFGIASQCAAWGRHGASVVRRLRDLRPGAIWICAAGPVMR